MALIHDDQADRGQPVSAVLPRQSLDRPDDDRSVQLIPLGLAHPDRNVRVDHVDFLGGLGGQFFPMHQDQDGTRGPERVAQPLIHHAGKDDRLAHAGRQHHGGAPLAAGPGGPDGGDGLALVRA
jgi:hypothetical protein